MPSWDDKESRFDSKKIAVLLAEFGFFSDLRKKNIRFNLKPLSNSKTLSNKAIKVEEENEVDLHLEIVKEIDDLLERHDLELQRREPDPLFKTQQTLHLPEFVEMRNPEIRKPEAPQFPSEFGLKNVYGELKPNGEFFEVEAPTPNQFELEKKEGYNRDLNSWMIGEKDKKYSMSLGRINGKSPTQKETKTEKTGKEMNGFTKTKIELERTKKEIEERRRALEEAERLEKEKEDELKIKIEEKKKEEKLKKLELKRKLKEKHIRERKQEKAQRQKEKELKRLEQEKLKQEKQSQLEKEKELKRLEQEKLKQEKQRQLEQEKLEKEKEIELKKLEKEKLEKEKQEKKELKILQEEKEKLEKEKEKLEKLEKLKLKKPEKEKEEVIEVVPPEMDIFIQKESKDETPHLDNDVEKLLPILDKLLEKLPDDVVDEFANSENFALYEKVMTKYKRK
jgi:hypothetical protein